MILSHIVFEWNNAADVFWEEFRSF